MTTSTATAGTTSTATATWEGSLRDGKGQFKAKSGAFQGSYSFSTRFKGAQGTNPEELLAAAHASCLSMALSHGLDSAGTPAKRITTTASAFSESPRSIPRPASSRTPMAAKYSGPTLL